MQRPRTATACPGLAEPWRRRPYRQRGPGSTRPTRLLRPARRTRRRSRRRLLFRGQFTDGESFCLIHRGVAHAATVRSVAIPGQPGGVRHADRAGLLVRRPPGTPGRCNAWRRPRKPSAATSATRPRHRRPERSPPGGAGLQRHAGTRARIHGRAHADPGGGHPDLKTLLTRMVAAPPKAAATNAARQARQRPGRDAVADRRRPGLARSLEATEPTARIDVAALLSSIADDASDAGQAVSFTAPEGGRETCSPIAGRTAATAIGNLVDNALKYGGSAEITMRVADGKFDRHRDHGPAYPSASWPKSCAPLSGLKARARARAAVLDLASRSPATCLPRRRRAHARQSSARRAGSTDRAAARRRLSVAPRYHPAIAVDRCFYHRERRLTSIEIARLLLVAERVLFITGAGISADSGLLHLSRPGRPLRGRDHR